MKKISSFIVNKRFFILGFMTAATIICALLIPKVEIITDMTRYLPDDSSMKIGLDIMAEEFPSGRADKTIRIMFDDLDENEKMTIKSSLAAIQYVENVAYEPESADYNKDNHTLYVISTKYKNGSAEQAHIERTLEESYSEHTMVYMNDSDLPYEIPSWLTISAISIMMVILFAMCGSWAEPFIFLVNIFMAIAINLGTNIIMGSVATITFSIAAILQLALSMDYSIILMNRYRQELEGTDNKTDAMKLALQRAFPSIVSSGITTVVGLLMLIFMSFKVGMDLGIVLAKGVLISMICVMTILPCLILMFDTVIKKTSKKELHIPTRRLASFSYRSRRIFAAGFALLFAASCYLQTLSNTVYSLETVDPVADVFTPDNIIVMLYNNDDEEKIDGLVERLMENSALKSAVSYPTMIGKEYTVSELCAELSKMDAGMDLSEDMIGVLYYDYFAGETERTMKMSELLSFLTETVKNSDISQYFDDEIDFYLDIIEALGNKEALTTPMSAVELAEVFDMPSEQIGRIFMLYYSQSGEAEEVTMTISELADFLIGEVAQNPDYSDMLEDGMLEQLSLLKSFSDSEKMNAALSYQEAASMLGVEAESVKMLYMYYYLSMPSFEPEGMTIAELVRFVKEDVAADPTLSSYIDDAYMEQLDMLSAFTDKAVLQIQMDSAELAAMFGINESMARIVVGMYCSENNITERKMSPEQFVDYLLSDIVSNKSFESYFDKDMVAQLKLIQEIMKGIISDKVYTSADIATLAAIDSGTARALFAYHHAMYGNTHGWRLSINTVIDFLLQGDATVQAMISADQLAQLQLAKNIIDGSVSGAQYTSEEASQLLSMEQETIELLYMLYFSEHGDTSEWKLTVQELVDFILNSEIISQTIEPDQLTLLETAQLLIGAVADNREMTAGQVSELLTDMDFEIDSSMVELLFLYHSSFKNADDTWQLSIGELLSHLTGDIMTDPLFENVINDTMREQIINTQAVLDNGAAQLKAKNHSILTLTTTLPDESDETSAFIESVQEYSEGFGNYYLIGNSAMSHEMSKSFGSEMLLITLLTALSIFLVVALTFRSISVPVVLVLIVQCGVYLTMTANGLMGFDIYYLALLIVQCILMGATIDYGILFTNYYRDSRETMEPKEAIAAAYEGSIHTIMTSGLILILVTGIIGIFSIDPTIGQICKIVSIGALSATLLILFVLPGLLATLDRFVVKRSKKKDE